MAKILNPFDYIKSIQDQWAWASYCQTRWVKKDKKWILFWKLSTGGLSDHEVIIDEMDKMFWFVCWSLSKRGGNYEFEVNPINWGYKLVNDYAREKGVSRQSIYNYPDKFEWIHVSKGVKFIKALTTKGAEK